MTEQKQISNSLTVSGELNRDELEMVSGGGGKIDFADDVFRGATLGALGIQVIRAVTQTVIATAKETSAK